MNYIVTRRYTWGFQCREISSGRTVDLLKEQIDSMVSEGRIRSGRFYKGKIFTMIPSRGVSTPHEYPSTGNVLPGDYIKFGKRFEKAKGCIGFKIGAGMGIDPGMVRRKVSYRRKRVISGRSA